MWVALVNLRSRRLVEEVVDRRAGGRASRSVPAEETEEAVMEALMILRVAGVTRLAGSVITMGLVVTGLLWCSSPLDSSPPNMVMWYFSILDLSPYTFLSVLAFLPSCLKPCLDLLKPGKLAPNVDLVITSLLLWV